MTPARRHQLLEASRLGRTVLGAAFGAPPEGRKGDLDPDGRWRTISGNHIHITAEGEIDAGGHPALRDVLAEKAGLHPKGESPAAPAAGHKTGDPVAWAGKRGKLSSGVVESVGERFAAVKVGTTERGSGHKVGDRVMVPRGDLQPFGVPAENPAAEDARRERRLALREQLGAVAPAVVKSPRVTPESLKPGDHVYSIAEDGTHALYRVASVSGKRVTAVNLEHPDGKPVRLAPIKHSSTPEKYQVLANAKNSYQLLPPTLGERLADLVQRVAGTKPMDAPFAHGYGNAGAAHPVQGDREKQWKTVGDILGRSFNAASNDDESRHDPMGLAKAGPPPGLDMDAFVKDLSGVVGRHQSAVSVGPPMEKLYKALGKKYDLSKHDFLRAVAAVPEDAPLRFSLWGKTVHELPDPQLALVRHGGIQSYVHSKSHLSDDVEKLAALGDEDLVTDHPAVAAKYPAAPNTSAVGRRQALTGVAPAEAPETPEPPAAPAKAPPQGGLRAEITEGGKTFKTGVPVTFRMVRNLQPAPKWRKGTEDTYQQAVEPAGRYMSHDPTGAGHTNPAPHHAYEEVTFKNPLVVPLNTNPDGRIYNDTSWKMNLSREFGGKKGQSLSNAVARAGHDGIVTVDKYGTGEIVDLRHLHPQPAS